MPKIVPTAGYMCITEQQRDFIGKRISISGCLINHDGPYYIAKHYDDAVLMASFIGPYICKVVYNNVISESTSLILVSEIECLRIM